MKIFQTLCIIAGMIFIAGASVLSATYGFTVGNAVAFCIGTILIAFGTCFRKLPRSLQKILIVLAGFGIACFLIITGMVIVHGSRNTVTFNEDCLLVLGCGIRGETLLPTLQARLDRCLEYHAENPDVPIVVSGGQGPKEDISEAEAMKRYLVQNGINEAQIISENKSRNTKENIMYSKQLLDDRFLRNDYVAACITSDYHVLRTEKTAGDAGLNVRFFNADVKWYLRPSAYCREALSLCKYWIFG